MLISRLYSIIFNTFIYYFKRRPAIFHVGKEGTSYLQNLRNNSLTNFYTFLVKKYNYFANLPSTYLHFKYANNHTITTVVMAERLRRSAYNAENMNEVGTTPARGSIFYFFLIIFENSPQLYCEKLK